MYNFWSFFTRKRNFSYLVLMSLIVTGTFAVFSIQKESNPEVNVPIGIVSTTLPGASAADIETLITDEIEQALTGSLEDVKQITSNSQNNVSIITVEFDANANLEKSIQDLKDRVDTAKPDLPEEANDPVVAQIDFSQEPILTFAIAGDIPASEFTKIGQDLQDDLESIPGVSSVSAAGLRKREVQVIVDPAALERYGLSITAVTGAISRANTELPVGSIEWNGIKYNLQFNADISDPSEIDNVVVTTKNSQPIYVRDLAQVVDGLAPISTLSRVSINGEPSRAAVTFSVLKQAGSNVTDITDEVNGRLAELQKPGELLADLDVLTIFDTGDLLRQDLTNLTQSGIVSIILVISILYLTLGWREALVAGLSIPLSFMIAFAGLLFSGNTINFVSLFSLILSVGILVDSAIVIVEGIHSHMKEDPFGDKQKAALRTIKEFHVPVTAGTMTTVAVFVPLFFISGIVGEFIKSIPFTIISVLFASLLVALGFVPLIASLVLRRRTTSHLEELQEIYTKRAFTWYEETLSLVLGHRRRENIFLALVIASFFASFVLPIKGLLASFLMVAIVAGVMYWLLKHEVRWLFFIPGTLISLGVAGLLVSQLPAFLTMKVEFFPAGDQDYVIVEMELPEGTTIDSSELEARKIEEVLYTEPDIQSFVMTVGASSPYSGNGSSGSKFANAFIELKPEREYSSLELGDVLTESLAPIKTSDIRVTQLQDGPPTGTPVVITFRGNDRAELDQLAVEAARILRTIPGTNAVTTSTKNDNTEFVLTVDKAKAATYGIDPQAAAFALRTAIEGVKATTINTTDSDIEVMVMAGLNPKYVEAADTNNVTISAINNIKLTANNGQTVSLGSVVSTDITKGSTAIKHEDGSRIATAASDLTAAGNAAQVNAKFKEVAATELTIPDGVEMIVGGENEDTDQSFQEMGYSIIAGLILMFGIIVLMFNSFRHAIYVIAPAFFSFIGIALGLTLTGNALSFPSLMGLIALIGIVVNNSIILIDVMNTLRRTHPERSIEQVVLEGSASRLRPIMLTTITTVIGIIPLLFTASFWAPLALSIIFGLSFSVIITLALIPVIYSRNPGKID